MTAEPAHGGALAWARARFAVADDWLDLSTGINPHPYPFSPPPPEAWTRLPEAAELAALVAVAAARYGAAAASCAAAPGVQALIQLLPRLRPPATVAVVGPTYGEHAPAWEAAGHEVSTVAAETPLPGRFAVVVITNPNNPDGARHDRQALLGLAAELAARGGWLVVDESYADVAPEISVAADAGEALVVLRSFGKFYGLPGPRLGFALAAPALAARVRAGLGPWPVSGPALAVGIEALADAAWAAAMRERLGREAISLDRILAGAGLDVLGGTALFRWVGTPHAEALFEALGARGILARRFADQPRRLRFGLPGSAAAEARLAAALRA